MDCINADQRLQQCHSQLDDAMDASNLINVTIGDKLFAAIKSQLSNNATMDGYNSNDPQARSQSPASWMLNKQDFNIVEGLVVFLTAFAFIATISLLRWLKLLKLSIAAKRCDDIESSPLSKMLMEKPDGIIQILADELINRNMSTDMESFRSSIDRVRIEQANNLDSGTATTV